MRFAGVRARLVNGKLGGEVGDLFADALLDFGVANVGENVGNPAGDLLHLRFAHAPGGDGRAAEADATGFHGRQRVEGNGVFVDGDAGAIECFFGVGAGDAARMDFDQEEVIVGTAADDAESALGYRRGHGFGVGNDLF